MKMILIGFAIGFIVGVVTTLISIWWLNRRAEHEAFKNFWGPP